ncbi:hypothetical protein K438DRAFT_1882928 [Mycena galopus ATCC 62051]|nr:hypothetical protein K438DRAFT_1882928 [Mycena galopus ATCC 62051]
MSHILIRFYFRVGWVPLRLLHLRTCSPLPPALPTACRGCGKGQVARTRGRKAYSSVKIAVLQFLMSVTTFSWQSGSLSRRHSLEENYFCWIKYKTVWVVLPTNYYISLAICVVVNRRLSSG